MKRFDNISAEGNERALRFGPRVPEGGVNLAYIDSLDISPEKNVVVLDTSGLTQENSLVSQTGKKLYYANEFGVLIDENDDPLILEEKPVVTDVFSVDEDNSVLPGSEYTEDHILPYLHVSRFFHLAPSGLVHPSTTFQYKNPAVKIIDRDGREYVRPDGTPRYKIHLAVALQLDPTGSYRSLWAYRVLAYIDSPRSDLFLTYSKVELDTESNLVNRETAYKETVNQKSFFEYIPEESEVVDPRNRDKKIFSTNPIYPVSRKRKIDFKKNGEGFKAFVPRKAIGDPRLYQLFRWRLKTTFIKDTDVDVTEDQGVVKCGIVIRNSDTVKAHKSRANFALKNLEASDYNVRKIVFQNPLQDSHTDREKRKASYWHVNIDEVDLSDLREFDFLIYAPVGPEINPSNFFSAKLNAFVDQFDGTFLFDSGNWVDFQNLFTGNASIPVWPTSGAPQDPTSPNQFRTTVDPFTVKELATYDPELDRTVEHPLVDGAARLGGWDLTDNENNNEFNYMSETQLRHSVFDTSPRYAHFFVEKPTGYRTVLEAKERGSENYFPVTVAKEVPNGGSKILTTIGQSVMCNFLIRESDNSILSSNYTNDEITVSDPAYTSAVNSVAVEGAMKFLYNCVLLGLQNRALSDINESEVSSRWVHHTPWISSWVIDGLSSTVLDDHEKERYNFFQQERNLIGATPDETIVWKRQLSDLTVNQFLERDIAPLLADPVYASKIEGAFREFDIEVSNSFVKTNDIVLGGDHPSAWTELYSPEFKVPEGFGPHMVREEIDASGEYGRNIDFTEKLRFSNAVYPPKKYRVATVSSFIESEEQTATYNVSYTARAVVDIVREVVQVIPPPEQPESSGPTASDQLFTWKNSGVQQIKNMHYPNSGQRVPINFTTFSRQFYYSHALGGASTKVFPVWGFYGSLGRLPTPTHFSIPAGGETLRKRHVEFIQRMLNGFKRLQYYGSNYTVGNPNGIFDINTENLLKDFQRTFRALVQNGVADAETMYIFGGLVERARSENRLSDLITYGGLSSFTDLLDQSKQMRIENASDGSTSTHFSLQSDSGQTYSRIWDWFMIRFKPELSNTEWDELHFTPHLIGDAKKMKIDFVHVSNEEIPLPAAQPGNWGEVDFQLADHIPNGAQLKNMNKTVEHNVKTKITLPSGTKGRFLAVGFSQKDGGGPNTGRSKYIGLKDLALMTRAEVPPVLEPEIVTTYVNETITVNARGNFTINSFEPITIQAQLPPLGSDIVEIRNTNWVSVTVNAPEVNALIEPSGKMSFYTQTAEVTTDNGTTETVKLPRDGFQFYSKDINGTVDIIPENGHISKDEGIKLLCDISGNPVGFPWQDANGNFNIPTDAGASEAQFHYLTLKIKSDGSHSSVLSFFYDFKENEVIVAENGQPEMSYIEYIERGPHNVFIGVSSDFESLDTRFDPVNDDAVLVPHKWAMPVYGVEFNGVSKISIEKMADRLDHTDVWSIPIKDGVFDKRLRIRSRTDGPLLGWMNDYQGQIVNAHYTLPEAKLALPFSEKFGKPHVDITDENPEIVTANKLKVKHYPISSVRWPTQWDGFADPMVPQFKIYERSSVHSDDWVEIPITKVKDYNLSTGEIVLKNNLSHDDPRLLKVDYVSPKPYYELKIDRGLEIDFNAYSAANGEFLDKPLYVYIVPHYVRDDEGVVIPSSVRDKVIRTTFDPAIFDENDPKFDPLALQLGVVYLSTALDPSEVNIIDTRRRGGGLDDEFSTDSLDRAADGSDTYWDIDQASGLSYPQTGYVIVRLPQELSIQFTPQEIYDIIDRNITAGVKFKVETLEGAEWS